jgi:hypothetical protein
MSPNRFFALPARNDLAYRPSLKRPVFFQTSNETTLSDYFFEMTTKSFKIDADGKLAPML